MKKDDLRKLIDAYLKDDGLDRDIVLLANQMGIDVFGNVRLNEDFVACTLIDKDKKIICINKNRVNDGDLARFILAYQLAEYVNSDSVNYTSLYKIDKMEIDNYMLAKDIVDRSYKYKKEKSNSKRLRFFKNN